MFARVPHQTKSKTRMRKLCQGKARPYGALEPGPGQGPGLAMCLALDKEGTRPGTDRELPGTGTGPGQEQGPGAFLVGQY